MGVVGLGEREYYNTGPLKLFSDLKWRVELECVGRGEGGVGMMIIMNKKY